MPFVALRPQSTRIVLTGVSFWRAGIRSTTVSLKIEVASTVRGKEKGPELHIAQGGDQ
jgi:hypothetical protein